MRNVPISFIAEETIERLDSVYGKRKRAAIVGRSLGLSTDFVVANWDAIEEHKWFVSEVLGRDTGDKVAALDYFRNVRGETIPKQSWSRRFWQQLLQNFDGDGPRSIVNLERSMRLALGRET